MRHGSKLKKFHRTNKKRDALMQSLIVALIDKRKITTTQAKAKSLRPVIEKLVTRSRNATLASTRLLTSRIGIAAAHKLIKDIGPLFVDRAGGYTRIRHLAPRISDGARMAVIEFVL